MQTTKSVEVVPQLILLNSGKTDSSLINAHVV